MDVTKPGREGHQKSKPFLESYRDGNNICFVWLETFLGDLAD